MIHRPNPSAPLFAQLAPARVAGMEAANAAAGDDFNGKAANFLTRYAAKVDEFITEELIAAAEREGLVAENRKSWGLVVRMAAKAGAIVNTGRCSNKTTNGCPKPIWKRATAIQRVA